MPGQDRFVPSFADMRNPASLEVLDRANELTKLTYAATRHFPRSERGGLTSQMQRCATSVSANIAEGCGRDTEPAFLSYLQNAVASVTELRQHAHSARIAGIGISKDLAAVEQLASRVRSMLAKPMAAVRKRMG